MFKKIEIWILYLIIFLGVPIMIAYGMLVRYEMLGGKKFGNIPEIALFLAEIPTNIRKLASLQKYQNIKLTDRFPLLDGFSGTPNLNQSYLLLSRYDGDLKEGIVELVDLRNFKVLHTWNPNIDKFNKSIKKIDEFKNLNRDGNNSMTLISHPKLTKNGDLLFTNGPLRKIDFCSNLVFQNDHDVFHHSLETDVDGNIWAPSHVFPQSLPIKKVIGDSDEKYVFSDDVYLEDAIVKLSPNGKIIYEKSVQQIFIDNGMEYLLFGKGAYERDPIHLNEIQPVNFDGKFWKKGDLFLSLRHQSMVLLYRPSSNKIIWKGTGPFFHQHDVNILNDYSISVFNNNSKYFAGGNVVDGHNEVITYNFKTNEYSSYLKNSLINNDVRTITEGRSEILPNGNLFIEETNYGRTLYFNTDGSLRWTHINRADNGEIYYVGWSRILYNEKDIQIAKNFLKSRVECNK